MSSSRPGSARFFQVLLSFGVSGALIAWIVWAIDWPVVWASLVSVRYTYLIPSTLLIGVHFVLRGLRWRYLLPEPAQPSDVRLGGLVDSILVGAFATFILPLRAGEFVRPLMLARQTSYPFGTAFASVVIERFFDLSMVLVSFGLMLPYVPGIPVWVERGALILTGLALGLLFFLIVGSLFPGFVKTLTDRCFRFLPGVIGAPLGKFVDGLLSATVVLKSPRRLALIVGLTTLVWGSSFALSGLYLWLFDIQGSISFAVAIGVILALAVAAPSAPGFIGVYQTACVAAFALFGYTQEQAIAYSLVSHAHQYVFFVLYGVWVMFKYNLSFRELSGSRAA